MSIRRGWPLVLLFACKKPDDATAERIAALEARVAALEAAKLAELVPLAIDRGFVLPAAPAPPTNELPTIVKIEIDRGGTKLNGLAVTEAELEAKLRELPGADDTLRVVLEATPDVPYADVVRVMDRVRSVRGSIALAVRRTDEPDTELTAR